MKCSSSVSLLVPLPLVQTVEEDVKARNNGTNLDCDLDLCLLNCGIVPRKHLSKKAFLLKQDALKVR